MTRARTKKEDETKLLLMSRRRCAFCFGLDGDIAEKKGQIAHVDQDSSNSKLDNLAYLCFRHHDQYDSTTRQGKGLTERELREYRDRLYKQMTEGPHAELPSSLRYPEHPNGYKNQLEFRLRELQEEYRLAHRGLSVGGLSAMMAMGAVILTFFGAPMKMDLLSGNHIVLIVGIVAASIIVYFSFVFRRVAKTRLEITRTRALLEIGSGESAVAPEE